MAYDDEDLFNEEFDFVDDDDETPTEPTEEAEAAEEAPPRRRPPARDKPRSEAPRGRGRAPAGGGARRNSRPAPEQPPVEESDLEPAPLDDEMAEDSSTQDDPAPAPAGPPADHVVHIYEFGTLKRTIPRKFTDEEAVTFAEEYTRTGKAYGRYAVATPDDEEPAPTFAGASRGQ